jgi:hypothetical protein
LRDKGFVIPMSKPENNTICGFTVGQINDELIPITVKESILASLAKLHKVRIDNPDYRLPTLMGGAKAKFVLDTVNDNNRYLSADSTYKLTRIIDQVNEYADKIENARHEYRVMSEGWVNAGNDLRQVYECLSALVADIEEVTGKNLLG